MPTTKIGHFQIKTLCYESSWNQNFVCKSCWPGSIEPCTVNHFHIWWEIMAVEQFSWGMYWTKKKPTFHQVCLVPLFTTRGVVDPPGNDPIISGTSIRSFRHLEHQNPSIIDWVIDNGSAVIFLNLPRAVKKNNSMVVKKYQCLLRFVICLKMR